MMWKALNEVAKAIHEEIVNGSPYEGWSGYMFDYGAQIIDAKVQDNELIIQIEFDEGGGIFELVLKPTDWRKAKPKKNKRKRAKDIRAERKKS